MENRSYFEQFAGDVDEIEIVVIPFSAKQFAGFDELKRQQVMSIAQTFMIPPEVWTAHRRKRIEMDGLTEGRIVHFVLQTGPSHGQHRPAMVVKVWNKDTGSVNLTVFADWENDGVADSSYWATSVLPDEEAKAPGTWHWIEKA